MSTRTKNGTLQEFTGIVREIEAIIDAWQRGEAPDAPPLLERGERVGMRLVRFIGGSEERYHAVLEATPEAAQDWILDLAPQLAQNQRFQAAEIIARGLAAACDPETFLPDLALGLAMGGARASAERVVDECLHRFPDHAWVSIICGDARRELGQHAEAERLYRRGLELGRGDAWTVDGARERLAALAS